jgi:hypothetical protein
MPGKTEHICQFCGSPKVGYQTWKRHERKCELNPANKPGERKEQAPALNAEETAHTLELAAAAGAAYTGAKPGASGTKSVVPPGTDIEKKTGPPADVPGPLAVFEQRFADLELSMGSKLQAALDGVQASLNGVPQLIVDAVEASVNNFMQARLGTAAAPVEGPGAAGALVSDPLAGAAKPTTGLSGILGQIDWMQILEAFIKSQGGGDINTGIVNYLLKQGKPKPQAGVDTKYMSRAVGQFQASIRNKRVDPDAQAMSWLTISDNMLKDRGLSSDQKGFWIGMKSAAETHFAARAIEAQKAKDIVTTAAVPAAGSTQP